VIVVRYGAVETELELPGFALAEPGAEEAD
jgi:hypothetical protein